MSKKKKEKEIPSEILSQEEIDGLLTAISTGNLDEKYWLKDANNIECVKANLKKVTTPKEYFDVVLELIEDRNTHRDTIEQMSEIIESLKDDMKLIKDVINKIM